MSYVLYLQEQGKSASTIKTDLSRHRDAICDPTAPGRRITLPWAAAYLRRRKYTSLVDGGMTPLDAHFTVSRLLGHERPDVTNIYLASVKGGVARGE